MRQYGFLIDLSRCTGCNACLIACKEWHNILPGPVKWLRVYQWETGPFPDIGLHVLPLMCLHCEDPLCARACPRQAIYKEQKYGAVLVSPEKCTGERKCWKACPYGAPQFEGDKPGIKMSKCNMCIDRLEKGNKPICVLSCSLRALEFGPIEELKEKYGKPIQLSELPRNFITGPSAIFKLAEPKKQILPWDSEKALELWQKRHPDGEVTLPDIFMRAFDISEAPDNLIGRNKLELKAQNSDELIARTTDDE